MENENFLPYRILVKKNLNNNLFKIILEHGGYLNGSEEKLFMSGAKQIRLKNYIGNSIDYYITPNEKAEIEEGIPFLNYDYTANQRNIGEALRRK